ncbi:glutamate synthase (NADPH/NADH) small chain [Aliiruegeria haliotis]|uniref:Glutamate synthase (NADPH/NADH) small chain n=1 Tax=Aliiruegeria haliotis TaxID=1280846 RepID=A0A2T0RK25_9RHOB|nr:NAD(P)-dependent oxidoreductase [Aliiruegeria haliotis]PRY21533.1 glutamate synthase (NADPH/NADH) small chain [Aliiruegeria haliotis]
MQNTQRTPGVAAGRLDQAAYKNNFDDLHPPFEAHEASVAADRCYFCHDAPCITACPTDIDIPMFIRQIQTGNPDNAARTIFEQNILGGMCARVCPTETLCEEVCVRQTSEGEPVQIGHLQRFATDHMMAQDLHPFTRAATTGRRVAVVGAGPAGLACAHRLAMKGHDVVIFDARPKPGGLNEYGIASYKAVNNFAEQEVNWLMQIGGIDLRHGQKLGEQLQLEELQEEFDAVFLGMGLAGVNALRTEGEEKAHVMDAVQFIADLRQADDLSTLPVGRDVVVIGGGMTAVDAAVQSKLLGAEHVTMVYRRGRDRLSASSFEQELASSKGVKIILNAQPVSFQGTDAVESVTFAYTIDGPLGLEVSDETFTLKADQVLKAIGQSLDGVPGVLEIVGGKITTDANGRSSIPGVWAGGDCASGGDDLTVTAVANGRDAAEDIHAVLMGTQSPATDGTADAVTAAQ